MLPEVAMTTYEPEGGTAAMAGVATTGVGNMVALQTSEYEVSSVCQKSPPAPTGKGTF
jgi:hypothetical protein